MEISARTPGSKGFTPDPEAVGGRAHLRLAHAPPPPRPGL
jgi:hypothetical protein